MSAHSLGQRLQRSLIPAAAAALVRLLAMTWRVRVVGGEHHAALAESGTPFVFILWHGELLPLLWFHRKQGVSILVSEHRDGELVAQAARRLGYGLVRGSTSRGGARALLEVASLLKRGVTVGVTPDGPRGPRHHFTPGAIVAAQRAGAPLLPIRASADRAWRLRSWDAFLIPKPFARVTIAYSAAQRVQATGIADAEMETARFEALLGATGEKIGA